MPAPVQYITVSAPDGQVMGYAWGDSDEVGWVDRKASSVDAYRAGLEWYDAKVRAARERGVAPLDVLGLLSREPGVGPVTAAPGVAAIEELARTVTPADDQRLLAALDRDNPAAWRELGDAFDALTDEDRKVEWGGGEKDANGVIQMPYPRYSKALLHAVSTLQGVGALTTEYRWSANPLPRLSPEGRLSPADAVRAAMAVILGERISDGMIDQALKSGLLDATVESLRSWYEANRTARNPYAQRPEAPQAGQSLYGAPQPQYGMPPAPYGMSPQPAYEACRFCGGTPVARVTFRAHQGFLILMRFQKYDGPMCGNCGIAVYRTMMTVTLWQGWWSPFSLFLFTPFTVVWNLVARRKVSKLPAPVPGQHGRQADPGKPVRQRPLAYIALIPVLWICFMIFQGLTRS
ncbi:DUF6508 domain-containing protein [Streptomyces ochraceiscleroticus]|uniref:DUF6508 domain-containing protein n=1 Tax=Streptomyces ochraceiscleroticus TaxID=47761 RepID=A0ABW1MFF4_9ACTN|nr:DUF6508 domain-containing protein [Streptomyces ochraceiscleroticus]